MAEVEWARSERLQEVVFPPEVGTKLWWICFDDLSNTDVRTGADDDINLVMVEVTTQGDASNPFSITDVRGVTRDCSASEVLIHKERACGLTNDVKTSRPQWKRGKVFCRLHPEIQRAASLHHPRYVRG